MALLLITEQKVKDNASKFQKSVTEIKKKDKSKIIHLKSSEKTTKHETPKAGGNNTNCEYDEQEESENSQILDIKITVNR